MAKLGSALASPFATCGMPFEFGPYSSLLLPLVLQGVIFSLLLMWRGWREARLADHLLALLLLLLTLRPLHWMLGFAGWYDSHDGYTTFALYFPWSWFLAYGPLAYLYFRSLTNRRFRLRAHHLWHFAPTALARLHDLAIFLDEIVIGHWWQGQPLTQHFATRGPLQASGYGPWFSIFEGLVPLSIFGYLGLTLWLYRHYRAYTRQHFSDASPIDLSWLRNFLLGFLLTQLVFLGFQVPDWLSLGGLSYVETWYSYFAWGLIIYYLSLSGYQAHAREMAWLDFELPWQKKITHTPQPTQPAPSPAYRRDPVALTAHMERRRPYLDPSLTLKTLAHQLGWSADELSRMVNGAFDQNFNDYISSYRVKAVQMAMRDPALAHLSLLGLALESGFNSKATFNRVFKQHTGLTPSAWRKQEQAG